MAHNEQAEVLRRQISEAERLMRHFDKLREKVIDLVEKAPHDPVAARRLRELERMWNSGLQQKAEQMQQDMKEVLRLNTQYQQIKRQSDNGAAGVESPEVGVAPAQRARISIKKKARRFA